MRQPQEQPTNDFLHRNPALYEQVFTASAADFCLEAFDRHLGGAPPSLVDFGCGTGRDAHRLAQHGIKCTGVDFVPTMIEYARATYSGVDFRLGDMRELRLHQRFHAVLSLGSNLNYMLSNRDLERAIETFRIHCADGGLLVIEPLNTASFVACTPPSEFRVSTSTTVATARATYAWRPAAQVLERHRVWTFADGAEEVVDGFKLRLLFTQELAYFLERAGFEILETAERQRSAVYAKSVYIVARARGTADTRNGRQKA